MGLTVLSVERFGLSQLIQQLWQPLRHLYLIIVVLISWVFFRSENLSDSIVYLKVMLSMSFSGVPFEFLDAISFEVIFALIFGLILSTPVFRVFRHSNSVSFLIRETGKNGIKYTNTFGVLISITRLLLISTLLFLSAMSLASSTHNPFIYFRF